MTPQQAGGLPRGELLGRYRTYEEAQQVVDHLAASEGFDVKMLTIVGNDLRSVEHIRSRLSYPRVAGAGAAQGAMFGAFIGFLMYLFGPQANPLDILFAVLLGSAVWMIVGVIGYAVRRGRRDFASSSQLVATSFDVVCSFDAAGHARRLMQGVGVSSMQPAPAPGPQAPVQQPAPGPQQPVPGQPGAQPGPDGGQPEGSPAAQAAEPRAGYGDLPDGRPRYGVRTTSSSSASSATSAAPAAEQQASEQQGPEQQTPEQAPSESAEPSAPQDASSQQDVPAQQPASSQQAPPQDASSQQDESSEETTR
ncbi:hypothetical protein GCM10020260_02130 [Nesterenkonia halobia]|uniref:General stress protein 17M-like domain-containing protein n=2 Tax=Nesterenkonia halobia TaxID=37922 RepID=A0ABP6R6K4_9MICC